MRQMGDDISSQRTVFAPEQADSTRPSQMEAAESTERNGTYEPDDSRNVTGASGGGMGSPGGSDQQSGGERWGGGQQDQSQSSGSRSQAGYGAGQQGEAFGENTGQQSQFESGSGGQFGDDEIREHMEVIGADGVHLGTVDKLEGDRIKLTKADSGMGSHEGHHHYISRGLIADVEGDTVRLSATAANAYAMEEEE
jgi:hypothetical protein